MENGRKEILKIINHPDYDETKKDEGYFGGEDKMNYQIGDIVRTKKQHPCGSKLWEITRIGVDFKLKCQGCEHVVILPRQKALKIITKVEKRA